jgi:light-regulated signal transduction histidine kinase (bacteriophytochrome)
MIDGVLQYSSLDAIEQDLKEVRMEHVFKNIIEDLEVLIKEKDATIKVGQLVAVRGSSTLIYQLFYNLVNNSLKFSRKDVGPVIEIQAKNISGDELVGVIQGVDTAQRFSKIEITDNGIGFEQVYAEKIFESFLRLNSKDKYEGTGLGLALCKKIVERHQGFIKADGRPGKGATFTVYLPGA